jgi:hypothetical protein
MPHVPDHRTQIGDPPLWKYSDPIPPLKTTYANQPATELFSCPYLHKTDQKSKEFPDYLSVTLFILIICLSPNHYTTPPLTTIYANLPATELFSCPTFTRQIKIPRNFLIIICLSLNYDNSSSLSAPSAMGGTSSKM